MCPGPVLQYEQCPLCDQTNTLTISQNAPSEPVFSLDMIPNLVLEVSSSSSPFSQIYGLSPCL